ncbi:hypothetical protein AKJ16_DCAP15694 [Drosera capensis]
MRIIHERLHAVSSQSLTAAAVAPRNFAYQMSSEQSALDRFMIHLRQTCRYYTGYPKDLGPSRVIHFTSEREFVQILHQGYPVVVAFTIRGNYTRHLDKVLEEAAVEFYPNVGCPKYPGFCITRQKKEYPFVELFHSPEQRHYEHHRLKVRAVQSLVASQGRVPDPNISKYSVRVLPVRKSRKE